MIISLTTFAMICGTGVLGLVALVFRMQKENNQYVEEVKQYLQQRIVAHNQTKARYSILKNRFTRLENENRQLRQQLDGIENGDIQATFDSSLNQTIIDEKNQRIEQLEMEISSIEKSINGDIKESLTRYMQEVDGLSQRLDRAKEDITTSIATTQDSIKNKDVA